PHHFPDIDRFLAEAYRVLKPDRDAAFVDCAPPLPARDVLHEVEMRRDPSHVLSLTVDEWVARLEVAGFEVEMAEVRELDWNYEEWMNNMAVAAELAAELAQVRSEERRVGKECRSRGWEEHW